jgi:hypothetical protein
MLNDVMILVAEQNDGVGCVQQAFSHNASQPVLELL